MNGSVFVFTPADVFGLVLLAAASFLAGMTIVPRTTIALLVLFIGLGVAKCAHAEPLTVGLHLHSVHVPAKEQDNNSNWGAYVRTDSGLTVGGYRNTLRRNSFYIGQSSQLIGPVDVTLGGITGYKIKDGQGWSRSYIAPLVALSAASPAQVMGVTPRLTLVPGHLIKARTVLHISVEGKF